MTQPPELHVEIGQDYITLNGVEVKAVSGGARIDRYGEDCINQLTLTLLPDTITPTQKSRDNLYEGETHGGTR